MKKMIAVAAIGLFAASTSIVRADCGGDHGTVADSGSRTITVGSAETPATATKTTKPGS